MIDIKLHTRPIAKDQVFHIKCDFSDNEFAVNMPDRKWVKGKRVWEAPLVRLNIEYLKLNRGAYLIDDSAQHVINSFATNLSSGSKFPSNYPFKTIPFQHQEDGVKTLYPYNANAIFADIGTGKTKMAIDMAACRYYETIIDKVLVIALVSIKDNWDREINIHSPIKSTNHILQTKKSGINKYNRFLEEDGFKWLIVGVESFSNGKAFDLTSKFVDKNTMIIIDESDSIKTDGKIRTERCISLGKITKYKTIMTGTPLTQGLVDLYPQFEFLDSNIIGIASFYAFRNRYAVMGGFDNKSIIGYQRVDELLKALGKHIFQVRKRDVLKDLPESSYQRRTVKMSVEQKKLYMELKNTLKLEYNGNKLVVANTINLMQRFCEITCGYYSYIDNKAMDDIGIDEKAKIVYKKEYLKSNPKVDELFSMLDKISNDEPVIIWANGKMERAHIFDRLSKKYGPYSTVLMDGSVSRENRTKNLDKFQGGEARFLLGNQSVGGVGLNMTVAAITVYISNDFSLKKRLQSEGRMERIGQKRPMLYIDIVCASSIDIYILNALRNKKDFAEEIRKAFDGGYLMDIV